MTLRRAIFAFLFLSTWPLVVGANAGDSSKSTPVSAFPDAIIVGATLIDGTGAEPVKDSIIYIRDGKTAKSNLELSDLFQKASR